MNAFNRHFCRPSNVNGNVSANASFLSDVLVTLSRFPNVLDGFSSSLVLCRCVVYVLHDGEYSNEIEFIYDFIFACQKKGIYLQRDRDALADRDRRSPLRTLRAENHKKIEENFIILQCIEFIFKFTYNVIEI